MNLSFFEYRVCCIFTTFFLINISANYSISGVIDPFIIGVLKRGCITISVMIRNLYLIIPGVIPGMGQRLKYG